MDFLFDLLGVEGIVVIVIAAYVYFKFIRQKEPDFVIDRNIRVIESLNAKQRGAKNVDLDGPVLTILYYSQTGTAEDFATRLGQDVEAVGIPVVVVDVEDYETDKFAEETSVVFFAATYGEGDPPDSSQDFHAWLLDDERLEEDFTNVNFSVFGLGNSTYEHYNFIGKQIQERLTQLNAKSFYPYGEGDDDKNIEDDFLVWKKDFKQSVAKLFPDVDVNQKVEIKRKQKTIIHDDDDPSIAGIDLTNINIWRFDGNDHPNRIIDGPRPFMAKMLVNKELHTEASGRSCRHIEFSTHDGILKYESGDHLGVYPENDLTLVHKLASQLGEDLDQIISVLPVDGGKPIVGPCSLKAALTQYYDITNLVRKPMLRVLAHYATDEQEKRTLEILGDDDPDNQEEYKSVIVNSDRNITDVLKLFKSTRPPLDHFLEALPKLQARYYSISSSFAKDPSTIHVTAVVVEWTTPTRRDAKGVTTNWFANHIPGDDPNEYPRMPVFIRPNVYFKLPKDPQTPIIMVGPGTGLAPFRGFIQDRALQKEKFGSIGETILYFGCRHPEHDFLYQEELENYHNSGIIELHTAFSRFTEEKVYVQHKMLENTEHIWELLQSGAHFYLCGDANRLVKDVQAAITTMAERSGMNKEEAEEYLKQLISTNYFADVW